MPWSFSWLSQQWLTALSFKGLRMPINGLVLSHLMSAAILKSQIPVMATAPWNESAVRWRHCGMHVEKGMLPLFVKISFSQTDSFCWGECYQSSLPRVMFDLNVLGAMLFCFQVSFKRKARNASVNAAEEARFKTSFKARLIEMTLPKSSKC